MSSYIHNKKISSSEYFDRIRKSGRDQFTVMPEFGVTVYDAINAPFDRDSNKPVYAHLPSRESQIQKRGAYQANQSLTTMYKRKAPSNAYSNARFDAEFGPSAPVARKRARTELQMRAASQQAAWQAKASLATQVRRLIAGKKKDAADVNRFTASGISTSTRVIGLTSTTNVATAASTTGLIQTDSDKAHINSVTIRGNYILKGLACTAAQAASAVPSARVRHLLVWFYKPATQASAPGTLPLVSEVLVSDAIDSLVVPDTQNQGKFAILSDRVYDLGRNLITVDAAGTPAYSMANQWGPNQLVINQTYKINREMSFAAPCTQTNPGGHYDSDSKPGLVSRGLLILYVLAAGGDGAAGTDAGVLTSGIMNSRLNYTA